MGRISDFIREVFPRKQKTGIGVEELRTAFKARYHSFKLLLNANNKALEVMAEMEEALKGARPFGMSFVSARCTSVSTNVWQMIKHLNDLASGQYEVLHERFKEIQIQINPFLRHKALLSKGPLVVPLEVVDKDMADQVGGKMANLGEIKNRIHLRVPNGFVITARAYQRFMEYNDLQTEIDRRIQARNVAHLDQLYGLSAAIQQLVIGCPLPEDLESAILENYRVLEGKEGKGIRVAMRSSALGEDFSRTSFAGQYRTELNVSSENIVEAYKEIVASKYTLPAMNYRFNRGLRDEDIAMCVGCLRMVDALSGGVIYSRNPVNIRDEALVINAAWGLPKSVVEGSTVPDLFILSRKEPIAVSRKEIPFKEKKFVCYPEEGVCRLEMTSEEGKDPSINDEQAVELARLAIQLEAYYGVPQDIEWAVVADGSIVVLQCRPFQTTVSHEVQELKDVREEKGDLVILHGGVTASPGAAAGPVYIVKKDMDALQFPYGAVLVAVQSLPRWASLLNRAVAIITEQGSIAGHLANVAREFGVPALFGIKGALDALKKDQMVTVDADGVTVYEGRIQALLERQQRSKNLMLGSPIFESLKGVAQNIVPLFLLDPDAPTFKAGNCKTFHDITRFCHEKAVHEMFQFGKEHEFPERSSKQLLCDVPMQWWVLNLDDGFSGEVEGKYVQLEDIVSIPMRALWEGIMAFPWEGPPPVDGKGFLSIMFEATKNTALVPGLRSRYGDRNYFMVSKNYCSLNSRFGFHFSIVETLVSERSRENYISFQFKGGAADDARRQRRILFVTDILEEYDFRVEVKEDYLIARLEDRKEDFMRTCLKILGYLIIHTRQLDMIMSNDDSVTYYRSKIRKEIRDMLSRQPNRSSLSGQSM